MGIFENYNGTPPVFDGDRMIDDPLSIEPPEQPEGLLKDAADMESDETKRRRRAGELLMDPPEVPAPRER